MKSPTARNEEMLALARELEMLATILRHYVSLEVHGAENIAPLKPAVPGIVEDIVHVRPSLAQLVARCHANGIGPYGRTGA